MPFEWVVGDSSKDHTVTASTFYDVLATVRYTTLRGTTHLEGGRWLAAIGVEASLCVRAGIRVPFGIVDFQAVVGCDVHDAILDDLECVTDCKFLDPEENTGQI